VSAELIYRRILVALWTRLAGLSDAATVLILRLLTGPETTPIPGVVIAGRAGLSEAMGWPQRRFDAAVRELEGRSLVRVDWGSRLVWVPAAVVDAGPANPNVVIGWRSVWAQLPASSLRDDIQRELWGAVAPRGDAYRQALVVAIGEPSSEPLGEPLPPTIGGTIGEIGSGSGGGREKGRGGGAGTTAATTASLPPDPDPGPDHAIEAAVEAFRRVRDRAVQENPLIATSETEDDRRELRAAIARLEPRDRDPDLIGKAARLFFTRNGRDRKDMWWHEKSWGLFWFARQGLESCLPHARIGITSGWPDDFDMQVIIDKLSADAEKSVEAERESGASFRQRRTP
jgi:hypothetical protein